MADIFISYSQKDRKWVTRLVDALTAEGWNVWWDINIRSGESFDEAIERKLRQVHCVVAVWSANAVKSKWVRAEAAWAADYEKVVSIQIEDEVGLPLKFYHIQTDDFTDWDSSRDSAEFRKLAADIRKVAGAPTPGTSSAGVTISPAPLSTFRDRLRDGGEGPEMVMIPTGSFMMGSPEDEPRRFRDEGPRHRVTIARPFAMGTFPVTFEEYDKFAKATGQKLPDDRDWGRGERPVINVSWEDAVAYAEWLSQETGKRYRLPTEAEWEYAARAGTETAYWWGSEVGNNRANCDGCGSQWDGKKMAPVGCFEPNLWGLYDVHGNVWEWVQDCWHEAYSAKAPTNGEAWESGDCSERVIRGGSWDNLPRGVRSANRSRFYTDDRGHNIGFRLAQDL